jgi:hypothetical protein
VTRRRCPNARRMMRWGRASAGRKERCRSGAGPGAVYLPPIGGAPGWPDGRDERRRYGLDLRLHAATCLQPTLITDLAPTASVMSARGGISGRQLLHRHAVLAAVAQAAERLPAHSTALLRRFHVPATAPRLRGVGTSDARMSSTVCRSSAQPAWVIPISTRSLATSEGWYLGPTTPARRGNPGWTTDSPVPRAEQ